MDYSNVRFEAAFGRSDQLCVSDIPEICFSGRSNVGKSSLINRVIGRKALARVSSTPGKTVTINFYNAGDVRLVDLPGYGYAKVAGSERERWADLMESYFRSARDIRLCLQLADMRHGLTVQDISMLEFLIHYEIPFALVLTKSDKLNKTQFSSCLEKASKQLADVGADVPIVPFSALKNTGTEEIRRLIEESIN